jgi:hypothetical protein
MQFVVPFVIMAFAYTKVITIQLTFSRLKTTFPSTFAAVMSTLEDK